MSGPAFNEGDRVRFFGSGQVMHVIAASATHCYCNWVDAFGVVQRGTFDQRTLTHTAADSPANGDAPLPQSGKRDDGTTN